MTYVIKDNKEEQWFSGFWVGNSNFISSKQMAKKFKYWITAWVYSKYINRCSVEKLK